jgi:cyclic-di-GMP-binding protein
MLSWLKGEKVDHPLASARELKRVIKAFPARDAMKTLEDANDWLDSLNDAAGFKVDQRFDVIDQLDTATRKAQDRLRESYHAHRQGQLAQEKRIWKVATDFWNSLGAAYLNCARQAQDADKLPAAFKPRLSLLAARATYALRHYMHWVLMRYGVLRAEFWSDMALCAVLAESSGAADQSLEIVADGATPSSQPLEFLRTVLFWAASPSGLSPVEQDIAERLVGYYASKCRMDIQPSSACDYCFDLEASRPPLRFTAAVPVSAATRYIDGGGVWQAVQAQAAEVSTTGTLPQGIDWGPAADGPSVARVLRHLGLNWAKEMPVRSAVRRRTALQLRVMHGYQNAVAAIEPGMGEELDFSATLPHDAWIAEDVSSGGYGVIVPAGKGEWLRVGALAALRTETNAAWELGIVRRVKSDEHRQHRAGIQLISRSAMLIHLRRVGGTRQGGNPQTALLLAARPSRTGSLHVVARRDLFDGREPLEATYGNPAATVTLDPGGVVESGQDFDWLRYKLLDSIL